MSSKGAYLREQLAAIPGVEDISGLGLMIGFRVAGRASADVVKDCMKKGLMMLTAKDKVRLLPPLTITKEEMDRGLAVLRSALG